MWTKIKIWMKIKFARMSQVPWGRLILNPEITIEQFCIVTTTAGVILIMTIQWYIAITMQ